MREIKFRVWDGERFSCIHITNENCGCGWRQSPHTKFQQYTGLKDKNGKEIYEGDILIPIEYLRGEGNQAISWDEDLAGFVTTTGLQFDECLEVIGNTYENPELLEVKA